MDPGHASNLGYRPAPPPLPKYDPNKEAPMWDCRREWMGLPVDKGPKPWTRVGTQPKSSEDPDWRGVIRDNVIEYPVVEPYDFGYRLRRNYFFFDTPDYADPFKKLGYSFRFFTCSALFACTVRGSIEGMKFNMQNNLFLFRRTFIPTLLGGMAASATVVTIANLRGKKDDMWNYVAAGLVFGCAIGFRNSLSWFKWTVASVPVACIFKYNAEINGQLIPQVDFQRYASFMLGNNTAEDGISSGDLRFGLRGAHQHGDPGRDLR